MALSGSSLLSVHLVSDVLIALASFAIPPALVALVRKRRDVPLPSLYLLFAAVFFAGGTTSLFDVHWRCGIQCRGSRVRERP